MLSEQGRLLLKQLVPMPASSGEAFRKHLRAKRGLISALILSYRKSVVCNTYHNLKIQKSPAA